MRNRTKLKLILVQFCTICEILIIYNNIHDDFEDCLFEIDFKYVAPKLI